MYYILKEGWTIKCFAVYGQKNGAAPNAMHVPAALGRRMSLIPVIPETLRLPVIVRS